MNEMTPITKAKITRL